MTELEELAALMARLRGPDGCPWDRQQTHESLRHDLLEECYEVLEAIDAGDAAQLADELGDLLLQVVFHAQIAGERGTFDLNTVARRINEKLRRRHPHVFGEVSVRDADEVVANWERLKREEPLAEGRRSALDGVPQALPALLRARAVQKKAARVGFDWADDDLAGPMGKIGEELAELKDEVASAGDVEGEVGDLLFAVVNVARKLGVDAEDALRLACRRFAERFQAMEEAAQQEGRALTDMTLAEMDELWEQAKDNG
jgi:tetrapyrrole methylase family protein/MazG family protein